MDPVGGFKHVHPERDRYPVQSRVRKIPLDRYGSTRQSRRIEIPQNDTGVRDSRLRAAFGITHRTRNGTGAVRTHLKRASRIDAHDAPAARTHLRHVDHWEFQRIAATLRQATAE